MIVEIERGNMKRLKYTISGYALPIWYEIKNGTAAFTIIRFFYWSCSMRKKGIFKWYETSKS